MLNCFVSNRVVLVEKNDRFNEGGANGIHQCDVILEIHEFCKESHSFASEMRFEQRSNRCAYFLHFLLKRHPSWRVGIACDEEHDRNGQHMARMEMDVVHDVWKEDVFEEVSSSDSHHVQFETFV